MVRKRGAAAAADHQPDAEPDSRGERTRKGIKQAIARLAARKDVSEINISEICKAARVTTGALYFHFKGKDEAVEEMIIDEVRSVNAMRLSAMRGESFADDIRAVLALSSAYHRTKKRLPRAVGAVINSRPHAYQAWLAARRPVVAVLEADIARERLAHKLSAKAAPYLAHFILNSLEDLALDLYQWGNPTLAPFAETADEWDARQTALWSWAILAPFDSPDGSV